MHLGNWTKLHMRRISGMFIWILNLRPICTFQFKIHVIKNIFRLHEVLVDLDNLQAEVEKAKKAAETSILSGISESSFQKVLKDTE